MSDSDDAERALREGFAALVRDRPALGPIDLAAITGQETRPARRSSPTRWVAVAAALVLIAGAGLGIWFGLRDDDARQAVPAGPSSNASDVVVGTWLLTQINGDPVIPDATGHVPSLTFGADSKATGQDPCNSMGLRYKIEGDRLTLSELGANAKSCGNESVVEQQGAYVIALTAASRFARDGRTLTLLDPVGAAVLVFRSYADNPPVDEVLLRIRSELPVGIKRATAGFPGGSASYGPLAPSEASEYVAAGAYSYAAVAVVTTDGDEFRYQPTDFTGETPLPPGRYTYVLSVAQDGQASDHFLNLRLEADQ